MPRNGTGTYSLPAGNPVTAGSVISETWANQTLTDIATALTQSLAADGQTVLTADLGMSNNKLTALANGTAVNHAATLGQVQTNVPCVLTGVAGTTTAYTATLPYSTTGFTAGQWVVFVPHSTNTGAATLTINGGTAKDLKKRDGTAVAAGYFVAGQAYVLIWSGTEWRDTTDATAYLQLAGGTLTGNLNGTTADFSGAVGVGSLASDAAISGTVITASSKFAGPGTDLTGTAASLTAGAVSSISSGQVTTALGYTPLNPATNTSGYTTPTPVAGTNCTVSGAAVFWIRIGSYVLMAGSLTFTPTTGSNAATDMYLPIPVASNFTALGDADGIVNFNGQSTSIPETWPWRVQADTVNDRLQFLGRVITGGSTGNLTFSIMYKVA